MALIWLGQDGNGVIWIKDEKPDKTFVMLACSVQSPFAAGVAPDASDDGDVYPLFRETPVATILDLTALPPGPQRFESAIFLERAADASRRHEIVTLDPGTVHSWGLLADGGPGLSP
jgi:hypothetical protein